MPPDPITLGHPKMGSGTPKPTSHWRRCLPAGGLYELLCFHAQQAAEKSLKAVLIHHGGAQQVEEMPPAWYKSYAYRSRVVREPRAVWREFGLEIPEAVEIRVWDSNFEVRYMALPERPAGTEQLSEDGLAALVTCDAMIGVAKVTAGWV